MSFLKGNFMRYTLCLCMLGVLTSGFYAERAKASQAGGTDIVEDSNGIGDTGIFFYEERVSGLKVLEYDSTSFSFGWDKLEGAVGYEIWRHDNATNSYNLIDETDENKYGFENLSQGTVMSFLVRAYTVGESGERIYSNYSELLTLGTRPDDVAGLKVVSTTDKAITLEWEKVSDDASYIIYRIVEGTTEEVKVGTTTDVMFVDNAVASSMGYAYKVYAFSYDDSIRSENAAEIITASTPQSVLLKQCKGGEGRVRIRWSTATAGNGYIIYMKSSNGYYTEAVRINDMSVSEYIVSGLVPFASYSFIVVPYKSYDGKEYHAMQSNEMSASPTGQVRTSTAAAVFKTNKKLKKSASFKKYKQFSKYILMDKNVIVPGISLTNVDGFASSKMVLQAVCIAGDYMLITAYDSKGEEKSVVYVINRYTGTYITTLVLPDSYHVGGIAFDGANIWLSAGKSVSYFLYADIVAATASGADAVSINYRGNYPVCVQASFISCYKDMLWVGEHKEKSKANMYGYMINDKTVLPTLVRVYKMKIPSRTQDVEFITKKKVVISRSNQTSASASRYYISRMEYHKLDWSKQSSGIIKTKKNVGKITMPPMLEGIIYHDGYLYTSFESASIASCPHKLDRICTVKFKKLKWK